MIEGTIRGQEIGLRSPTIAADSMNYLSAVFQFQTSDWDGLLKIAHFSNGTQFIDIELKNDRIVPSDGLNLTEGTWLVTVTGHAYSGGELIQRVTTTQARLKVMPSVVPNGEPLPSLLSYGEQILGRVNANMDKTESVAATIARNLHNLVADRDYLAGEYVMCDSIFYRVIHDISIGEAIVPGENVEATTVGEAFYNQEQINSDLHSDIEQLQEIRWSAREIMGAIAPCLQGEVAEDYYQTGQYLWLGTTLVRTIRPIFMGETLIYRYNVEEVKISGELGIIFNILSRIESNVDLIMDSIIMNPRMIINASNVWAAYVSNQRSAIIKIPDWATSLAFTTKNGSVVSLLASYDDATPGSTPYFASGYSGRLYYTSVLNITIDLTVTNARYLYYAISGSTGNNLEIANIKFV